MRKFIFTSMMTLIFVCLFAISVSAASQSYASFEVVKSDNTRITVYTVGVKDRGNGQMYLREVAYTEAPADSEGTYDQLDWSTVKEIDFTTTALFYYDSGKSTYYETTGGTNGNANGSVSILKGWSDASTFITVKKVNTGNAYSFDSSLFRGWQGIDTVVFGPAAKTISDNMLMDSSVANLVFDENCQITRCANNPFSNCDNLVSVELPDSFTYLGNSGLFNDCDNLESVKWSANCPKIPGSAFMSCEKLVFEIPSYIDEIKSSAFNGCTAITSMFIPKSVAAIGSDCFRGCKNLTSVVFEEGCSVTAIYAHTFDGCAFSEITLPNTVQQLRQNAFANNKNLKVVNLGASFVDFNLLDNLSASLNSGSSLEKLYLSKNFTSAGVRRSIFGDDGNKNEYNKIFPNLVIYYEGDKAAAEAIVAAAKNGDTVINGVFAFMTVVSLDEYEALKAAGELSGRYMIYSYNRCDAFYGGVHAEGKVINSCQYGCGRECGLAQLLENPQHQLSMNIVFGDMGYFSASKAIESCSVCKTLTVDEDIAAMFVDYGYSVTEAPINGAYSMSQFYGINREAIEQYRAYSQEFAFGFVVAASADPFGALANGELPEDKVFVTTEDLFAYDYVSVRISGISDAIKDKAVAFCMFVNDGEDIYYLDGGETVDAVAMKSYNDLISIAK